MDKRIKSSFQRAQENSWRDGLVVWTEGKIAYISVAFSWMLEDAYQNAVWYNADGYTVIAGGPAVAIQPDYLKDVAIIKDSYPDAITKHNPSATFTSRGCIRNCRFCIVPRSEGVLIELDDWPVRPIICDNNFLGCSIRHINETIDKLKPLSNIDFNQGLDARLLEKWQAERLAELDLKCVRLAWDSTKLERHFMRAFELLRSVGFPASKIRVYVLIGFNDTPDDALYRLETVRKLGALTNPMRYQPINTMVKNKFVSEHWIDAELKRYMRYWSNLRVVGHIPFDEFAHSGREIKKVPDTQMELL